MQNYDPPGKPTRPSPAQLRQTLGYVPSRAPMGAPGSGVVVDGGPAGPVIGFDSSFLRNPPVLDMGGSCDGEDGQLGPPGPRGPQGVQGPIGPSGMDGLDGNDGSPGPQGATGATGATGAAGPQGLLGPRGFDGEDGEPGPPIPGPTGPTGATGATGPQGIAGLLGPPGFDGEEGPEGLAIPGPIGAAGATGATGPQGAIGFGMDGLDGEDGMRIPSTLIPGASSTKSIASPTAANSTSVFTMQGLAGAITPQRSGNILVSIAGTVTAAGATTVNIGVIIQGSYGTGTAPTSNAALTGTQAGAQQQYTWPVAPTATADVHYGFNVTFLIPAATLGVALWLDLAAKAVTTVSDAPLTGVIITAVEL